MQWPGATIPRARKKYDELPTMPRDAHSQTDVARLDVTHTRAMGLGPSSRTLERWAWLGGVLYIIALLSIE